MPDTFSMQAMIKSVGLLCALRLLPLAAAGWGDATMDLSVGPVKGNVWGDAEEFLAIPYASIPKRFDPSVPLDRLPGKQPFDATNILGHGECACAQAGPPYTPGPGKVYGVEHCLILNIYRKHVPTARASTTTPGPRPVLLWIFGGDNGAALDIRRR